MTTPKTYPTDAPSITITMLPEEALAYIAALNAADKIPSVSFRIGMLADTLQRKVSALDRKLASVAA